MGLTGLVLHGGVCSSLAIMSAQQQRTSRTGAAGAAGAVASRSQEADDVATAVDQFFTILEGYLSPAPSSSSSSSSQQASAAPSSTGGGGQGPCILFEVTGLSQFYLVQHPPGLVQRLPPTLTETRADCRVSSDLETLLSLLMGTLKPVAAVATGRLRVTGDRTAFRSIGPALRHAARRFMELHPNALGGRLAQAAAGAGGGGKGGGRGRRSSSKELQQQQLLLAPEASESLFLLDRGDWEEDSARKHCSLCRKAFTVLSRRRHHCRMCGFLFCNACSEQRILGHRVCSKCCDLMLHTYVATNAPQQQQQQDNKPQQPQPQQPSDALAPHRGDGRPPQAVAGVAAPPSSSSYVSNSTTRAGVLADLIQARLEGEQAQDIAWRGQAAHHEDERRGAATTKEPAAKSRLRAGSSPLLTSLSALLSHLLLFSFWAPLFLLVLLPFPPPPLLASLLFLLLFPPSSLPPSLAALLLACYLRSPALPPPSSLSSSLLTPLDHSFLHLVSSSPPLVTAAVGLLVALLLPLRYWLYRGVQIYATAGVVIGSYMALSYYCRLRGYNHDEQSAKVYERADVLLAPFVCRQFMSLKSLFLKFGQYIGGRADVVPPTWANSLAILQDQLPPCPPSYVRGVVSQSFGRPFWSLFSSFDFEPLASASVAQVHRATLKDNGREVAVKVQHRGVEATMRADMAAAIRIARFVAWLNQEYKLLLAVLTSWANEMERELDFRTEASNLERAIENLRRAGLGEGMVVVPQPVEKLVAKKTFAMDFIHGFKITDTDKLDYYQIDRAALMRRVAQAFSSMFFVDGFFNADPHAGNVMVSVTDGVVRPVLLDFGMTVEVPGRRRAGYCQLVHHASHLDLSGAAHALKNIGYATSQSDENPERDVEFFQFLMRDTGSREEQRQGAEEFTKRRREQREEDKKQGKTTSRYMKEIPSEVFFLFRMLGLIRGLCTTLGVALPYMDIMAQYAQKGLVLRYDDKVRARRMVPVASPLPVPGRGPASSPLEVKVRQLLVNLIHSGQAIGMQVCVYRRGRCVLDVCGGVLGAVDPRPVEPCTLFPVLDLSSCLTALVMHSYARDGTIRYDVPLVQYWPAFVTPAQQRHERSTAITTTTTTTSGGAVGDGAKRAISLRHVLSHSWGLHHSVPASSPPSLLLDHDRCCLALSCAQPSFPPGSRAVQSLVAHGHCCAALLRESCGVTHLPTAFTDRVARPLKVQEEVFVGGSAAGQVPDQRVAKLHNGFATHVKALLLNNTTTTTNTTAAAAESSSKEEGTTRSGRHDGGGGGGQGGEGQQQHQDMLESVLRHVGCVNQAAVRAGLSPSVNGVASARALARIMDGIGGGGGARVLSRAQQAAMRRAPLVVEDSPLFGKRQWSAMGFQVEQQQQPQQQQQQGGGGGGGIAVLGHEAFGGSTALLFPSAQVSIGITVNNLTLDKGASRQVLRLLTRELGLPLPAFTQAGLSFT